MAGGMHQADVSHNKGLSVTNGWKEGQTIKCPFLFFASPSVMLIEKIQTSPGRRCLSAAVRQFPNILPEQSQYRNSSPAYHPIFKCK